MNRIPFPEMKYPLVAILRGLKPEETPAALDALLNAGFRAIEIPLNSPEPFKSIEIAAKMAPADALIGAGTVLTATQAEAAVEAGARLLLAPNFDPATVARAKALGVEVMPGVATASEAFAALAAGANALKLFPARELGAGTLAAWSAVLPAGTAIYAVGGVDESGFAPFVKAGVAGFGLGSSLYRPGDDAATVAARGARAVAAWRDGESGQ